MNNIFEKWCGNGSYKNDNFSVAQLNDIYVNATQSNWKPTSERNHNYVMEKYVLNIIGHYKIKNVNSLILQREVFDPLMKAQFKEGTLISIYRRISAIFSFAVNNEFLDRKRFTTPNYKKQLEVLNDKLFPLKKIERILEVALTKYKITHYTCLSILFLTGMRVGEMRALQWENDIDFKNNVIHINKTKVRFGPRSPRTKIVIGSFL